MVKDQFVNKQGLLSVTTTCFVIFSTKIKAPKYNDSVLCQDYPGFPGGWGCYVVEARSPSCFRVFSALTWCLQHFWRCHFQCAVYVSSKLVSRGKTDYIFQEVSSISVVQRLVKTPLVIVLNFLLLSQIYKNNTNY